MPPRPRIEAERSVEVSLARLSPRFGCGQMLKDLPRFDHPEALVNIMDNYGYRTLHGDKAAQRLLGNSGLLKPFYDNAFSVKLKLRQNFFQSFNQQDLLLAHDPKLKAAWFVGEPRNRMALDNYYRDAVSLGIKAAGITLTGATVRLTPVGWQNLHDLMTDTFIEHNPEVKRIEVMSVIDGVRWRHPSLGLGVTFLNFRETGRVRDVAQGAVRGESGEDIQN